MSEWKDISTAPKDGRRILICTKGGFIDTASWNDNAEFGRHKGTHPGWVLVDCEDYFYSFATADATHWMPLPEPPNAKNKEPETFEPYEGGGFIDLGGFF